MFASARRVVLLAALLVLAALSAAAAKTPTTTSQPTTAQYHLKNEECAMPTNGCSKRHVQSVCTAWNGCVWMIFSGTTETCGSDPTCSGPFGKRVSKAPTIPPTTTKAPAVSCSTYTNTATCVKPCTWSTRKSKCY